MSAATEERLELEAMRSRVRELELENARLTEASAIPLPGRTRRFSWRAFTSAVLIIVATILVPLATIAGWTKTQLVDEQVFVSTLAPLAQDPAVRAEIVEQASTAIIEELEVEALVGNAFDGLTSLDIPSEAALALALLREPAINGTQSLINNAVTELVHSEAFANTWEIVLTASHRALVAAASGSVGDGQISIGAKGDVVLHLGPVISDVKVGLIAQGFDLAKQIPEVDTTITLTQSDALAYVGPVYRTAVTLGWVLPFLSLGLFIFGIAVARNRRTGVIGSGIGLVVGSSVTLLSISGAAAFLASQAIQFDVAPAAIEAMFGHVTGRMVATSVTLLLLGVLLIVIAWVTGGSSPAQALRGTVQSGTERLARSLSGRGFTGGAGARWLLAQRTFTRSVLVVLVVLALIFLPITVATVVWTMLLALVAWWILALFERVAACAAVDAPADTAAEVKVADEVRVGAELAESRRED